MVWEGQGVSDARNYRPTFLQQYTQAEKQRNALARTETLENQLTAVQDRCDGLTNQNRQFDRDNQRLRQQVSDQQKEIDKLRTQYSNLRGNQSAEVKHLQAENAKLKQTCDHLENEIVNLQSQSQRRTELSNLQRGSYRRNNRFY